MEMCVRLWIGKNKQMEEYGEDSVHPDCALEGRVLQNICFLGWDLNTWHYSLGERGEGSGARILPFVGVGHL